MTTQPPAFTPQDFKVALAAIKEKPWGYYYKEPSLDYPTGSTRADKLWITDVIRTALQQCAKGCGDGYVMVPAVMTDEMHLAFGKAFNAGLPGIRFPDALDEGYKAMIAAASPPNNHNREGA